MGRHGKQSSKLLLDGVLPSDVGARVGALVRSGAARLGATVDAAPLERDAEALAVYAQAGAGLSTDQAKAALARVCAALYSRARDEAAAGPEALSEETEPEPVGLALRGAWTRVRVASDEDVDLPSLALLAGITRQNSFLDAKSGKLKAHDGPSGRGLVVAPVSARGWLEARGVAGYGTPRKR